MDGRYWHWLNDVVAPTLLKEFRAREDTIKYIEPNVVGVPNGSAFIHGHPGEPAYEDPETRPWKRDVIFAYPSWTENGNNPEYIILPIFYYDEEIQQIYTVISVLPIRVPDAILVIKETYLEDINIPALIYS